MKKNNKYDKKNFTSYSATVAISQLYVRNIEIPLDLYICDSEAGNIITTCINLYEAFAIVFNFIEEDEKEEETEFGYTINFKINDRLCTLIDADGQINYELQLKPIIKKVY